MEEIFYDKNDDEWTKPIRLKRLLECSIKDVNKLVKNGDAHYVNMNKDDHVSVNIRGELYTLHNNETYIPSQLLARLYYKNGNDVVLATKLERKKWR